MTSNIFATGSVYKTNKFLPSATFKTIPFDFKRGNNNNIASTRPNILTLTSQVENLKTQNTMINRTNHDLLSELQENMFRCYTRSNNRHNPTYVLTAKENRLNEYFRRNLPQNIQADTNYCLLSKQNELIAVKSVLERQINQNKQLYEIEKDYCEKMGQMNDALFAKVKELNQQNDQLTYERKKLQKTYALMEENLSFSLMKEMTKIQREPEVEIPKIEIPVVIPQIEEQPNEESDEEARKRQYKVTTEKVVQMKMNHKPGKLDQIRKNKIEQDLKEEQALEKEKIKLSQMKEKYERPLMVKTEMIVEKGENAIDPNKPLKESVKQYNTQFKKMETKDYSREQKKNMDDLSSKTITVEQKLKVLKSITLRFEKLCAQTDSDYLIYTDNSLKANKHRKELKEAFNELLNNPNAKKSLDIMTMLVYDIVNSNYHLNLNPEKLKEKNEYDPNDFEQDINQEYRAIIKLTLDHFKKVIQAKRATMDISAQFLAKSLLNFDYDEFMLARLISVIEYLLES